MAESPVLLTRSILVMLCMAFFIAVPAHAFTANSLDITVDKSGDATAVFRFTLEGIIENAIPQSVLEEQLLKGLAGSSEPPTLVSMDRSSATLLIKKFANTYDVATGTDYQTSALDFKKAEIALQNSAVSSVITADFSPSTATITFPDGFSRSFSDVESLPSVTHTVVDPSKKSVAAKETADPSKGAINLTASPDGAEIYLDGVYLGNSPAVFSGISAGNHELVAKKGGYLPVTKSINVPAGRTLRISVYLTEAPVTTTKASSPLFGSLVAAAGVGLAAGLVLRRQR